MEIRPMVEADAEAAWAAGQTAFEALAERWPASTEPADLRWRRGIDRVLHLLRTDPEGSWVAESEGRVCGVAQALHRDGIWGLSLLAVEPAAQDDGIGRRLFARALAYAGGGRGRIVMASQDPRALRLYVRAGLRLLPTVNAFGSVSRRELPAGLPRVREGTKADYELAAQVDRRVRSGAHGPDLEQLIGAASRFHVVPGRGYVVHGDGSPRLLAATDTEAARALLVAALAEAPPGLEVGVMSMTAAQQWAIEVAVAAGLALETGGPLFVGGEVGPLTPYLPTPAYL